MTAVLVKLSCCSAGKVCARGRWPKSDSVHRDRRRPATTAAGAAGRSHIQKGCTLMLQGGVFFQLLFLKKEQLKRVTALEWHLYVLHLYVHRGPNVCFI